MSEPTPPFPTTYETEPPQQVWVITPRRQRLWLHITLLLTTFLTTTIVGAHMQSNFASRLPVFAIEDDLQAFLGSILNHPAVLLRGLPFSLTLMFILLAHEMGHYLYARHYRVYATLPYFIPFPSLIGTMGAFIRIKSPIPSRDALFDIGIAGPIAGFIPSCLAIFVGLPLSQPLVASGDVLRNQAGLPLFFYLAGHLFHLTQAVSSLTLHPIAAAGWVGLFATSLNLLPGGQLDGGHIFYAAFPKWHRLASLATVVTLLLLAWYAFWVWIVWAVVLYVTSYHPPLPRHPGISKRRKWIALCAVVMLILSLTPAPFTGQSARDVWPDARQTARDAKHAMRDGVRHWLHRK